jgi:uracil-DNA glycosylase family 4
LKVPIRPQAKGNLVVGGRSYHSYQEREEAINHANQHREGYYVVRSIQQAWPSHLPAIKHHFHQYNDCVACPLGNCPFVVGKVYYRGYIPSDVLFIGEAPGKNEDTVARPFIGESGKILDDIIIDVSKRLTMNEDGKNGKDNAFRWCITNSVLCLPYDQGDFRTPTMDEIRACNQRLREFIGLACPSLIVTVGRVAERAWNLICKDGVPYLGWSPDLIDHEARVYGHDKFQPLHVHMEHPSYWLQNDRKNLWLNVKKVVLRIHAVLKPLFQIEE